MREWLDKYLGPVILPFIALAILAGGIYLYASKAEQEKEQEMTEVNTENVVVEVEEMEVKDFLDDLKAVTKAEKISFGKKLKITL